MANNPFTLQHWRLSNFSPIIFFSCFNLLAWSTDSCQVNSFTSRHLDRNVWTEFSSYCSFCVCTSTPTRITSNLCCIMTLQYHPQADVVSNSGEWTVKKWKSGLLAVNHLLLMHSYIHFKCWQNIWPVKGISFMIHRAKGIFVKFHYLKSSWATLT